MGGQDLMLDNAQGQYSGLGNRKGQYSLLGGGFRQLARAVFIVT